MLQTTISARGEIVIPKPVRDYLGLTKNRKVIIDVKGKTLRITLPETDIVRRWEERAKRVRADVSTWAYGDRLYEEEFS